jgi:hypothetical protein
LRAFLATDPDPFVVGAVADWLRSIRLNGPPDEGVQVWDDDELHMAGVRRTAWVCRYFVVVHERLVLNRFEDP